MNQLKRMIWMIMFLMLISVTGTIAHAETTEEAPGKVTITSQQSHTTTKKYTVYWKKQNDATGYQIELYDLNKKRLLREMLTEGQTSYTFSGIKASTAYRMKIRAYRRVQNPYSQIWKKVYGSYQTVYFAQQPRVKFVWNTKKSVLANWTEVEGAVSYTVYLSTKRGTGYQKKMMVKVGEATLKKLKMETNYYVYVVANCKVNKQTFQTPVTSSYPFRLQLE